MEILFNNEKKIGLSLALGFFDGIHLGHKKVIENAVKYAKENGLKSAVISFSDHPSCFLLNRKPQYILPLKDKIKKIEELGIDYLYLLNFNKEFSQMSKEEYFNFLVKTTSPKAITTGFNHFFGKNKEGNTEFLKEICEKNNIKYEKISPVTINNEPVSSSKIRKALIQADFKTPKSMLGYDFYIKGIIVKGQQIGEKLGFKTININYPENIIKIPYGVYCTLCKINDKLYKSITNWGVKPTFGEGNSPVIETHIFNFNENIYNENAEIIFYEKIRDEKKFDTPDELKAQIKKDVEFCLYYKDYPLVK